MTDADKLILEREIRTARACLDVIEERKRQVAEWGCQSHPDGTAKEGDGEAADQARLVCDSHFIAGTGTWRHILLEEVREAFAEGGGSKALETELLQVAAVAVAWVEDLRRRRGDVAELSTEGGECTSPESARQASIDFQARNEDETE